MGVFQELAAMQLTCERLVDFAAGEVEAGKVAIVRKAGGFELIVLLCHKLALWQQGHLGSRRAIVRANLMRMLVMDDLTWRSVRIGGSAGSKTVG